jgi:ribonuclease R
MPLRKKPKDPYADREKLRYDDPVASRELIMETLKEQGKPETCETLQTLLGINTEKKVEAFRRRLKAMERDGQLITTRKNEYGLVSKMDLISGRVSGHRDGYGFVIPEDGSEDLFLTAKYMRAVFDGDRVLVRVTNIDRRGRREAALVQVLECHTSQVVGKLQSGYGMKFVVPDNKRISHEILIPPGQEADAREGQIVTAVITGQPTYHKQPIGRVIEILGDQRAPGMEIDIAVRSSSLPYEFPDNVLQEARYFKELIPGEKYSDREDIRHLPFVTIDGEDAMDFDDAIYCEEKPRGGWRLMVAIADVSFYVRPDTALENEALRRGNSVYFPGKVIPMLPEILSNGLCSLQPNIDRFCMVCDMQLNKDAKITQYQFYPAVMHSRARLTYTQVAEALAGNKDIQASLGELYPRLEIFHALYALLIQQRQKRGALDFDTVETKVLFDENRKIKAIVPAKRNDAHKMIEEAMLCANVCTAKFLIKHKSAGLFRVHAGPAPEKLQDLQNFLKEFNLGLRGGKKPSSRDYAELLNDVVNRPDASLIQTVLLRSLSQAVYSPDNQGHFGLAYEEYTHFTSPIRRYPDLWIHRKIREILNNNLSQKTKPDAETVKKLQQIGEHCSFTERRADEATRNALTALKCEFMSSRVGETYEGLVTAVTGFGLFVELSGIYIEGLVHITALPSDYYHFDPTKHRLTGERTALQFILGDRVHVKVVRVDVDDKKIDLELNSKLSHVKSKSKKPRRYR